MARGTLGTAVYLPTRSAVTALLVFLVVMNHMPAAILSGRRDAVEGDVVGFIAFGLEGDGQTLCNARGFGGARGSRMVQPQNNDFSDAPREVELSGMRRSARLRGYGNYPFHDAPMVVRR